MASSIVTKHCLHPPGCKIIAHEKPAKRRTWEAHGQPGWSLGPAMHHYRCQHVYIIATASERIVDTFECFPHSSPMPQMSSTDRILMTSQDITDAVKHPHPDVPFATIGDDRITALATLSEIFTRKFTKREANNVPPSPQKTVYNTRQRPDLQPVITSPIKNYDQPRTQTNSNQTF
jgi:hypothetical protein